MKGISELILEDVEDMLQSTLDEHAEQETRLAKIEARRDCLYRLKAKVQQRIAEAKGKTWEQA